MATTLPHLTRGYGRKSGVFVIADIGLGREHGDIASRTVLIVVFDGVQSLDVTGPLEVFAGANSYLADCGEPGPAYQIAIAGLGAEQRAGPVRTETGMLVITAEAAVADLPHPDIVLVPGGPGQEALMDDGPVHEWLRAASTWRSTWPGGSPGRQRPRPSSS